MGLFLRQDGGRSELQTKVASDLKERLKDRTLEQVDLSDARMLENQHETRPTGMIIVVLIILFLLGGLFWLLHSSGVL